MKILVPLDGSAVAEQALDSAVEQARGRDAELILLHSLSFPKDLMWLDKLPWPREWPELVRGEAEEYLLQEALRLQDKVRVRTRLEVGKPQQTILDVAREEQVAMIVMATHGRTGAALWLLGGVAHKIVQRAPCPVLLVPIRELDVMEENFGGLSF